MTAALALQDEPIVGLQLNLGFCPVAARGRRIRVVLRNGYDTIITEPDGWAADGRSGCRWSLSGDSHDILQWELI